MTQENVAEKEKEMTHEGFDPRILGFFCHWCCYAAADAAGVSRYQYPPNVRVVRVMCTGALTPGLSSRPSGAGQTACSLAADTLVSAITSLVITRQ